MKEAKEKTTKNIKDVVTFVKQLAAIVVGLSAVGLGFIAVYAGKFVLENDVHQAAAIFSGFCAVVLAFQTLFKTIMKK